MTRYHKDERNNNGLADDLDVCIALAKSRDVSLADVIALRASRSLMVDTELVDSLMHLPSVLGDIAEALAAPKRKG